MRGLIILFILLGSYTLYAQDQLVTVQGDTLSGTIEILFPEELYEEIIFDDGSDKKRLKAYEFQSIIKDGQKYRTIKQGDKYRIMMLEKDGYLSLYRFRIDKNFAFAGTYLYKMDGTGIEVPTMLFKKTMTKFLDGCNAITLGLEDGTYKRKEMEELVDAYNACIASNTSNQMAGSPAGITTTVAVDTEVMAQANDILKGAKEMGDDELTTMINDVVKRLGTGEEIPPYLKKAIEGHVTESHALYQQVTGFLSLL
ncbi:hypothetical protein [Fulvivirga sedimenti]|uniref:Uncharacterized protein n=1 Tax=Fulvivirga sedimenti TaxID=2879465 RepID=A0A9X1KZB5_9BACT|nr:hypothetical protein [Fulvivirga sedimenti]MCA6074875.1 hypothetical protein [Fulvivirga sedimenti]MCA6076052.1 hypothetical protein [Fulvivirga sedimenti]MCA6077180.1 hypothetical protein [Fulvivirga sedimenti]